MVSRPLIVGIGGTTRGGSQSEFALGVALRAAASAGAEIATFIGRQLMLPHYVPGGVPSQAAQELISDLRRCDGVIVATPSYHGSVSGIIKNALDYTEELRNDPRPYLHDRAVGAIVCAGGWQNIGTTLAGIRSIIHALRAWPTPLGAGINTQDPVFDESGGCKDERTRRQLEIVGHQVAEFAWMRMRSRSDGEVRPRTMPNEFKEAMNAY